VAFLVRLGDEQVMRDRAKLLALVTVRAQQGSDPEWSHEEAIPEVDVMVERTKDLKEAVDLWRTDRKAFDQSRSAALDEAYEIGRTLDRLRLSLGRR
jgi:hypothetical protein